MRGKCAGPGMERVSVSGSAPETLALHPFRVASTRAEAALFGLMGRQTSEILRLAASIQQGYGDRFSNPA